MRLLQVLIERERQELRRLLAYRILIVSWFVVLLGIIVLEGFFLHNLLGRLSDVPEGLYYSLIESVYGNIFLGGLVFAVTLLPFLVLIWTLSGSLITQERAGGQLETLLASPLSPFRLIWGKALGLFLAGWVSALIGSLIVLVSGNLIFQNFTECTAWIIPWSAVFLGTLGNALWMGGIIGLTQQIVLLGSIEIALIPSFVFGFPLMIVAPFLIAEGLIDLGNPILAMLWILSGALFCGGVVLLSLKHNREKILLAISRC